MSFPIDRRGLLRAGAALIAAGAAPSVFGGATGFFSSRRLPLGIQLYMLGDVAIADLEGTLRRVAKIGYQAVELPNLEAGSVTALRAAADKAGVKITSVHLGANPAMAKGLTILDEPGKIAAAFGALQCRDAVVPFFLLPAFKPKAGEEVALAWKRAFDDAGADPWKRTAALLNERAELLRREGISLSYHNHNVEFMRDGMGWRILSEETDRKLVSFEIDVAWVVAGGIEPTAFLRGLAGRVRQVHVKDLRAVKQVAPLSMDSTEVGSGIVEWNKVIPAAYEAGARQFYVEQEPPYVMDRFDAAAKSFAYLRSI